jgi:hypothetical protein
VGRWPALGVAAVIAAGAVGADAADTADPPARYFRVAVTARFDYSLEYGNNPDAVFNGFYHNLLAYTVNGIAVYDGRKLSVSRGAMIVEGTQSVDISRLTDWALPERVPHKCRLASRVGSILRYTQGAVVAGGTISLSGGKLSVDPGSKVRWNLDCSATEALETHGIPGGPQFVVPAPPKSALTSGKVLSIGCTARHWHDFEPAGNVNHHRFKGDAKVFVRLTPFPAPRVADTRKALAAKLGNGLPRDFGSKPLKSCL